MGYVSVLLWSLLGVYIAATANELWGLFHPRLASLPGEHVFRPSWGAARHGGSAAAARAQMYTWKFCVSSREEEMSARELDAGACVFAREDIQLNESLALQFAVPIPPRVLKPLVDLQEAYATLYEQMMDGDAAAQQQAKAMAGGAASPVTALAPVDARARSRVLDQLRKVKKQLRESDLFLHSFFYRVDSVVSSSSGSSSSAAQAHANALRADPWHVHSSTRIVARWIVPVNHTRNLLSGEQNGAAQAVSTSAIASKQNGSSNGTTSAAPAPTAAAARKQLIHYLRPRLHFQFVSEDLSFPASGVPPDLGHLFPLWRSATTAQRKFYAPIIAVQDLMALRRDWRPLNSSFIREVEAAATNATAGSDDEQPPVVFTTKPATHQGVSDSQAELDAARVAAATATSASLANEKAYTAEGVTVQVSLRSTSLGWFRLLNQMKHSVRMLGEIQSMQLPVPAASSSAEAELVALRTHASLAQDDNAKDFEEMKSMFVDSNPWLLLVTLIVSVVHLVLDVLAFKTDVSFWRSRKNNFVGISAKGVWINSLVRGVIFLYLVDQDASRLVLFSAGLSLLINIWKSIKVLRVSFEFSGAFPFILKFGEVPHSESSTQQHDTHAMKWLSVLAAPLVLGASVYSLVYQEHKSVYSWILGSCASAVYVGGFVLMTPQLFINYKLKSVAHLPLRVFIYRAFNTFIDDLFSFIIDMPMLHRLACFRDDIIFFIYLYQRWIYPVDHSRTIVVDDEGGEHEGDKAIEKKENNDNAKEGQAQAEGAAVSNNSASSPALPSTASLADSSAASASASTLTHRHAAATVAATTSAPSDANTPD